VVSASGSLTASTIHQIEFGQTSHWLWLGALLLLAIGGAAAVFAEQRVTAQARHHTATAAS
jgi:hypothetical protein